MQNGMRGPTFAGQQLAARTGARRTCTSNDYNQFLGVEAGVLKVLMPGYYIPILVFFTLESTSEYIFTSLVYSLLHII